MLLNKYGEVKWRPQEKEEIKEEGLKKHSLPI